MPIQMAGLGVHFRRLFARAISFRPQQLTIFPYVSLDGRVVSTSTAGHAKRLVVAGRDDQPMPIPPQRPRKPYILFFMQKLAENRQLQLDKKMTEHFKDISVLWCNLSTVEREKYYAAYFAQKEQWQLEYETFLEGIPDKKKFLKQMKAKRRKRQKQRKLIKEMMGQITFRKLTGYNVYIRDQLAGVPGNEVNALLYEASQNWKTLSPEKKEEYDHEASEIWQHRVREHEARRLQQEERSP